MLPASAKNDRHRGRGGVVFFSAANVVATSGGIMQNTICIPFPNYPKRPRPSPARARRPHTPDPRSHISISSHLAIAIVNNI